jgi:hypothetical protein
MFPQIFWVYHPDKYTNIWGRIRFKPRRRNTVASLLFRCFSVASSRGGNGVHVLPYVQKRIVWAHVVTLTLSKQALLLLIGSERPGAHPGIADNSTGSVLLEARATFHGCACVGHARIAGHGI